jgi:hypothetical protein
MMMLFDLEKVILRRLYTSLVANDIYMREFQYYCYPQNDDDNKKNNNNNNNNNNHRKDFDQNITL